jgi:large subunit ribosomal protein L25
MENMTLLAEPRRPGRHQLRELRNANRVPAVVYGKGLEPKPISVSVRDLHQALRKAGGGLLSLQIGDQAPLQVLMREVQRDPIKHHVLHVDFQAVSMTEKLRLDVPIVPEGEAPALATPDLVLVRHLDTIEVECLPADIPTHIVADLSRLKGEEDVVYVRDLIVPPGVEVLAEPDQVVFSLTFTRAAVEEEGVAEVAPGEVEVVAKGKAKEEEEEEEEK